MEYQLIFAHKLSHSLHSRWVLITGSYDQVSVHARLELPSPAVFPSAVQPAVNVSGWWGAVSCRNTFI